MHVLGRTKISKASGLMTEGRVGLSLFDPYTRKIKKRIAGKNHIFEEVLFSETQITNSLLSSFQEALNRTHLILSDSSAPTEANFPYIKGTPFGIGKPSTASSGLYQGAYNAANQVLGAASGNKMRWFYQYDFTAPQVIGTIRNLGLSGRQTAIKANRLDLCGILSPSIKFPNTDTTWHLSSAAGTGDGRYYYRISTAGVITKHDSYTNTDTTIDVSSVVGATTANQKVVMCDPITGKVWVAVTSTTAASRKLYRFSDNSFTTLEATINIPNFTLNSSWLSGYVYNGAKFYIFSSSNTTTLTCWNISTDAAITTPARPALAPVLVDGYETALYGNVFPYQTHYLSLGAWSVSDVDSVQHMYDMRTDTFASQNFYYGSSFEGHKLAHPKGGNRPLGMNNTEGGGYTLVNVGGAISNYVLPEPLEKPSNLGLTVTYEVEVTFVD